MYIDSNESSILDEIDPDAVGEDDDMLTDEAFGMLAAEKDEEVYTELLHITGYRWFSDMKLIFHTTMNADLAIENRTATLVLPDGSNETICAANATCASATVSGIDVSAKMAELNLISPEDDHEVMSEADIDEHYRLMNESFILEE